MDASAHGWFNYAVSYLKSAQELRKLDLHLAHKTAPVEFLYYHAIELLLKSYLINNGATKEQVKALGHRIIKIGKACEAKGLTLSDADRATLEFIEHQDNLFKARYIELGMFQVASFADLDRTAVYLATTLQGALYPSRDRTA